MQRGNVIDERRPECRGGCARIIQANTWVENEQQRLKYEVGATLRFVGYEAEEVASVEADAFEPGDLLRVLPLNGCGMGIDVRRLLDGEMDMVWPTEVERVTTDVVRSREACRFQAAAHAHLCGEER